MRKGHDEEEPESKEPPLRKSEHTGTNLELDLNRSHSELDPEEDNEQATARIMKQLGCDGEGAAVLGLTIVPIVVGTVMLYMLYAAGAISLRSVSGTYMDAASVHMKTSVTNVINSTNVAVGTLSLLQEQSLVNFLQVSSVTDYTRAHRHMIATLQLYPNVSALYAATTSNNYFIAVRNYSTYFRAEIGDGSCLNSYAVTLGATALATTVDYSTALTTDCSYSVATEGWFTAGQSAATTTWSLLYWNALGTPSVAAAISAASGTGVLAAELSQASLSTALTTWTGTYMTASALVNRSGYVLATAPSTYAPSSTQTTLLSELESCDELIVADSKVMSQYGTYSAVQTYQELDAYSSLMDKYGVSTTTMLNTNDNIPDWILVSVIRGLYDDIVTLTLWTTLAGALFYMLMLAPAAVHLSRLLRDRHRDTNWIRWVYFAVIAELIVWFIWALKVDDTVEMWAERIMREEGQMLTISIVHQFTNMVSSATQIQTAYALDELPFSDAGAADNVVNEKFMTGLEQLYPTLSFVAFGFPTGDLIGASYYTPGQLSVGVRSSSTSYNWIDYSVNAAGTRANVLNDYGYYDATLRPWYIKAAYSSQSSYNAGVFGDIYQWSGSSILAVPYSMPVFNLTSSGALTTTLVGVAAIDSTLTFISTLLASTVHEGVSYITTVDGSLVGTSTGVALNINQLSAMLTEDTAIKKSALALTSQYPNFTAAQGHLEVATTDATPINVASCQLESEGLEWTVVTEIPRSYFFDTIDRRINFTFLLVICLCTFFAWVLSVLGAELRKSAARVKAEDMALSIEESGGTIPDPKTDLNSAEAITNRISEKLEARVQEQLEGGGQWVHPDTGDSYVGLEALSHAAMFYLTMARSGRSVVSYIAFEDMDEGFARSFWLRMHSMWYQGWYRLIFFVAIMSYFVLEIWNHTTNEKVFDITISCEALITALLILDCAIQTMIKGLEAEWTRSSNRPYCKYLCFNRCCGMVHMGLPTYSTLLIFGTNFAFAALVIKACGYPGPMTFARALTLITRDHGIITGIRMLVSSIRNSKQVFLLFAFVLVFFAIESIFLFQNILPTYCTNFQDSLVFSFVFMATGENYADVLDSVMATEHGEAYFPFLAISALFGLFGLMSLIVATFEAIHSQQQQAQRRSRQTDRYKLLAPTFVLWTAFTVGQQSRTHEDMDIINLSLSRCSSVARRNVLEELTAEMIREELHILHQDQFAALVVQADNLGILRVQLHEEGDHLPADDPLILQAFNIVDEDDSQTISMSEFDRTLDVVEMLGLIASNDILRDQILLHYYVQRLEELKKQEDTAKSTLLRMSTTQGTVSEMEAAEVRITRLETRLRKNKRLLDPFYDTMFRTETVFNLIMSLIVSMHMATVAAWGTVVRDGIISHLSMFFNLIHLLESACRLQFMRRHKEKTENTLQIRAVGVEKSSHGCWGRWNSLLVHGFNRRITAIRRADILLVIFAFTSSVVLLLYQLLESDRDEDLEGVLEACMAVSILRLLALLPGIASLLYSMLITMKSIKVYAVIVVITMYLYSALATYFFGDDGNNDKFSDVFHSFITMFQLLIGEGWHEVMYDEANRTNRVNTWFFMSYVLVVGVLFSQLFIGLIISMYTEYEVLRKHGDLYIELALTQKRDSRSADLLKVMLTKLVEDGVVKDSTFQTPGLEDLRQSSSQYLGGSRVVRGSDIQSEAQATHEAAVVEKKKEIKAVEKQLKKLKRESLQMTLLTFAPRSSAGSPTPVRSPIQQWFEGRGSERSTSAFANRWRMSASGKSKPVSEPKRVQFQDSPGPVVVGVVPSSNPIESSESGEERAPQSKDPGSPSEEEVVSLESTEDTLVFDSHAPPG